LADELLPDWLSEYQHVVVLHLLELIKHTPKAFEAEFESEIQWLNQFIEERFETQTTPVIFTLSQAYKVVVKQKQLKDKPLPGFICCELNTIGAHRVIFLQYKSLILLAAIRLFLLTPVKNIELLIEKGHSLLASCVKNATNEVRWITLNRRPNTLDNLPDPDLFDLLGLFGEIDDSRNDESTPDAIRTSLSKYHTIFSNAYHDKPGKRKNRAPSDRCANKSQLEELEVGTTDEDVTVTEIRTSLAKTKNVAEWQREESVSSPPDAARYIVAINEQTTKNNQLNAILAHRFADQLKVRQQSAPCDFQGLSVFEVHQFIQHCINECEQNDNAVAEMLICSIAFGKTISQLEALNADSTANEHLRLTDNYLVYQAFHKLP
ncbi:MAG: hypothetical protein MJK04_05530, partial [Psychrosphaera sp.]|nr:hypothetical protein [Psychrosphaera sp.]